MMPDTAQTLPRDRFLPLPDCDGRAGAERRVGVEIEFAGLTEDGTAEICLATLGGRLAKSEAFEAVIEDSRIGRISVELDTAFTREKHHLVVEAGLDLSRAVIPMEIVTEPLAQSDLPLLETLREALALGGAEGSRSGPLRGFGVHFNVEIATESRKSIVPVTRAFALLEDWLRNAAPMDPSRRVLPFVEPYPPGLVDRLADGVDLERDEMFRIYLEESAGRNYGLDLLPLIAEIGPESFAAPLAADPQINPRPTWHYRLPDCRIDEPDWSFAYEWNRWVLVERVARNRPLMATLAQLWRAHRRALPMLRERWWRKVDAVLSEHRPLLEAP